MLQVRVSVSPWRRVTSVSGTRTKANVGGGTAAKEIIKCLVENTIHTYGPLLADKAQKVNTNPNQLEYRL